ncbi:hypothetical protein E2C01_050146 [Portunus trituberculatus]|uniref:Uncharacterized protein n=1 Tax=Portunus trituberculatus TaxID=210409 RepID=A0A5B7GFR0_PORTR|nr:hypothetical protein [Portunus trituberculatus]
MAPRLPAVQFKEAKDTNLHERHRVSSLRPRAPTLLSSLPSSRGFSLFTEYCISLSAFNGEFFSGHCVKEVVFTGGFVRELEGRTSGWGGVEGGTQKRDRGMGEI